MEDDAEVKKFSPEEVDVRDQIISDLTAESEGLRLENQALQAAYETQSKEYSASQHVRAQLSEINSHLESRIAELEAGIAQDEAELEIAVREMDMQMEALEDRAFRAEEALKKERETLAQQALEAADMQYEKILQSNGQEVQSSQQAAELKESEEKINALTERVADLEAALQANINRADQAEARAEAACTPAPVNVKPVQNSQSPSLSGTDSDTSSVSVIKAGNLFETGSVSGLTPNSVTSKSAVPRCADTKPSSKKPTGDPSPSSTCNQSASPRTVMSALFEQRRQRHRERAAQAASRMAERANFLAQSTPSRNRAEDMLANAVAAAARVAVKEEPTGYASELANPPVVTAPNLTTPEPMRPYTEQSLDLLKMELMKRGIKDFNDSEGKTGLIARLRNSTSTSPVTPLSGAI